MWTLICISQAGVVSASSYATEALAKEAQSVALTGLPIAEAAAAAAEYGRPSNDDFDSGRPYENTGIRLARIIGPAGGSFFLS